MSKIISKKEMKKRGTLNVAKRKDWWFCFGVLFLSLFNWIVFAFMKYVVMFYQAFVPSVEGVGMFYNFQNIIERLFNDPNLLTGLRNSAVFYFLGLAFVPIGLFGSYYVYKRFPGTEFFRLMFMLPSIISSMVWITVYKYFVDLVLPDLMGWQMGLMTNADTKFLSLILYGLWFCIGCNLVYVGLMNSVSGEVIEAGRLDGMTRPQELWHLLLPSIYSLFTLNMVGGLMGFFTTTGNTFEFYGLDAPSSTYTIGYIMFQSVMGSSSDFGFNSAGNILFTVIVAPLALIVKHLMEKFGPSEE